MLKSHEKDLMNSINLFLDNILKINNLFKVLLQKYFDQKYEEVENVTNEISELESECDKLRREVERKIYSETLIPEIRGDVLGMLENLDKIPGQIQGNAHSFNTEKPKVNPELGENFFKLSHLPFSEYIPLANFFDEVGLLTLLYRPLTMLPSLAVITRRLHDIDKSGWWCITCVTPLIIILIIFMCRKSDENENKYGIKPTI